MQDSSLAMSVYTGCAAKLARRINHLLYAIGQQPIGQDSTDKGASGA